MMVFENLWPRPIAVEEQPQGSEERYGLFTSAKPQQSQDRVLDIVAVHGLGGHRTNTWQSEDGCFWLRDLLPQRLTDAGIAARVMSFGYNSTTAFSKAVTGIEVEAAILLDRLNGMRQTRQEKARKILFIAHSLGGIVVKKAMVLARQKHNTYGEMLQNMCAVVFLAVPHCGANAANMANFVAILLEFAQLGLRSNRAYVKALKRNAETLAQITGQFVDLSVQLHIRTFFETERTAGYIIVEKESAILNLPNEIAVGIPESNHITICKFNRQQPQKFKPVWQAIVELAQHCHNVQPPPPTVQAQVKAGCYEWRNNCRTEDRWSAIWSNQLTEIKFSTRYDEPPRVLVGLRALDFGHNANLRAYASVVNITPISFRPALEHWSNSENYCIGGSWLQIAPGDKDFQNGRENTYGMAKDIGRKSGEVVFRKHVQFYREYAAPPTVLCWFTHIDSWKSRNHRLKVEPSNVTPRDFDLEFYTWSDSFFFELEAEWLAFGADRPDVHAKGRLLTPYNNQSHTFEEPLKRRFPHPKSCFLALNYIDSDCGKNTRIDVSVAETTEDKISIVAKSWSDSRIYQIGFTLLVIA